MIINLKDGKFIRIDIKKNEKGVFEYYSEGVLLGVYDPSVMKDSKFLEIDLEKNHTISDEAKDQIRDKINSITSQIKEKINETDSDLIENEAEENRVVGQYLREIGVDDKDFRIINEINLEGEEKDAQENAQEESSEQEKTTPSKDASAMEASKVDAKQEVDLDERATDMQNLKRWLETSSGKTLPSGATKIIAIDSDELRNMKDENGKTIDNPSSQYGLAIIRKDENGKMVAEPLKKYLPQLEQSRSAGTNPRKNKQQITDKTDGRTEEPNPINAEYTIDGSRRNIIGVDNDLLNHEEMHIGKYGPHTNETTLTQLRGSNTTFVTDTGQRKAAMGNFKGVHSAEKSKEELDECEDKKDYRDGDGDPSTKSNEHLSEMVTKLSDKYPELGDNYNNVDKINHLKEMLIERPELNEEEIIDETAKVLIKNAEREHPPRGSENRQ